LGVEEGINIQVQVNHRFKYVYIKLIFFGGFGIKDISLNLCLLLFCLCDVYLETAF
jgi:hypothetical protein